MLENRVETTLSEEERQEYLKKIGQFKYFKTSRLFEEVFEYSHWILDNHASEVLEEGAKKYVHDEPPMDLMYFQKENKELIRILYENEEKQLLQLIKARQGPNSKPAAILKARENQSGKLLFYNSDSYKFEKSREMEIPQKIYDLIGQ